MSTALIVISSYDPDYLRITEHLVDRAIKDGHTPAVLDVSNAVTSPVDSYHRRTLALFGHDYPGHDLPERLRAKGAVVFTMEDVPASSVHPTLPAEAVSELDIAVMSALITFYRTETPRMSSTSVRRIRLGLLQEGVKVYGALLWVVSQLEDVREIVVPNGRFPNQKMLTLAAHSVGVPTMHYEKGETPDGAYLQPYSPQSRLLSQRGVASTIAGKSDAEVEEIANAWLSRRAPAADSRNEFSALWSSELPANLTELDQPGIEIAGFFTSSQDEFQSLGPEWQLHTWTSQIEAFDAVMTKLEGMGYRCFLRVHPNLATKAQDSFRRERRGIRWLAARHPLLLVIWHDEPVNSYSLLERARVIVTWDSTIGLEASARGLPVWTTATSRYGLVADVRELLSPEAVEESDLTPWKVDPMPAKRFIAYLVLRDTQMPAEHSTWETWSPGSAPFGVRLSRVLVSGGNPGPTAAVKSLVDVYRHRSLRSNLRSISGRR